jgi:glycosyltransferase involved in cell wall biosynthesis
MAPTVAEVQTGRAPAADVAALMAAGELPAERGERRAQLIARAVTSLSVVIPAKDEAINLGALLAEVRRALAALPGLRSEVIVVDDGSTDATAAIAADAGARVVRHAESLGNGAAVKRGIREAAHAWILLLDGDGQHPPGAIPDLVALAERHDMVVGSRGGRGGAAHRNAANRVYNALASYVTGRTIPDLTSGFRLVRADVLKGFVYLLPNTFSYPTTITLAMLRGGYSVAFCPFDVRPRVGKSHINLLRDGSRFFLIILRIATFVAPLRVFGPAALAVAALGVGWYLYTYLTAGRFTNMAVLMLIQASLIFGLGLVSEQIAALRFDRVDERRP